MINHYRTLILNLADEGNPNEFIAPGFIPVSLSAPLQAFYNLLFPIGTSRYYKQFLYYYYEELIRASNQTQFLTSVDPRLTYTPAQLGQYFNLSRTSIPQTNSSFSLLLSGAYQPGATTSDHYEGFYVIDSISKDDELFSDIKIFILSFLFVNVNFSFEIK